MNFVSMDIMVNIFLVVGVLLVMVYVVEEIIEFIVFLNVFCINIGMLFFNWIFFMKVRIISFFIVE